MNSATSTHSAPSATPSQAVLDVRPLPGRAKHAQIFQRWSDLPVGGFFVLVNDHDPVPLRYQFDAQFKGAFAWQYLLQGPDEFRVLITKLKPVATPAPQTPPTSPAQIAPAPVTGELTVDARGLEPPEPLIRILDALETLPAGATLRAITDREPCHLFGEAEQRGFRHACVEQPDGSWVTRLERA